MGHRASRHPLYPSFMRLERASAVSSTRTEANVRHDRASHPDGEVMPDRPGRGGQGGGFTALKPLETWDANRLLTRYVRDQDT